MILIFDGPERSGKGTQSMLIRDEFAQRRMPVHYLYYPKFNIPKDGYGAYAKNEFRSMFYLMHEANARKSNLIFDRAHLAEWAYGHIYRDYDAEFIWDLEQDFLAHDDNLKRTFLVMMTAEPEDLIARDDGLSFTTWMDADEAVRKKQLEIDRFKDAFVRTRIQNKILVNSSRLTVEVIRDRILNFIGLQEKQ